LIPSGTPPSLKDIMIRCLDLDPKKRVSFSDILKENRWEEIKLEYTTEGPLPISIWTRLGDKAAVPWKDFVSTFSSFLEIPNDDPELGNKMEWQCIYALLEVDQEENLVKKDNYIRFLSFFSPVRTGYNEGALWLGEIKLLLSQKWFHGPIDSRVAANRISAQEAARSSASFLKNNNGGGLIIRFSALERAFTMTYKLPGKDRDCTNIRLDKTHYQDVPSLISFVDSFLKKMKIDATSYERKYQYIFENKIKPSTQNIGTYTDPNDLSEKRKK